MCRPEAACAGFPLGVGASPLLHLAGLYSVEGRNAEARETADKAWSRYPTAELLHERDIAFAVEAGELYSRLGDDAMAEKAYRLAVSQRPRMPPTTKLGVAESKLAYLCAKTGRFREAFDLSRDAVRIARLHGIPAQKIRLRFELVRAWIHARLNGEKR